MMFKALAFSLLVAPSATANLLRTSRQLSEDKIAGYEPSSQVTDHNALDMDQNLMETYLSSSAFDVARSIYEKGGHSKSYAEVTVTSQGGLPYAIAKDERVRGFTSDGRAVAGTALDSYGKGSSTFGFLYFVSDDQSNHVGCMVGGLPLSDQKLDDCLVFNGTIEVANRSPSFVYEYNQQTHNKNDRTLKKFSTSAQELMFDCETCPYKTYEKFREYYGEFDYGDKWVTAAFGGVRTGFSKNGNMDFSNYGDDGKRELIKKGTAYMNVWMYVIREMEDAIDDCDNSCLDCNGGSAHAWDEAVAFYSGSIEGADKQGTSDGVFLHSLADKRCINFRTCGEDRDSVNGLSAINLEIFRYFNAGKNDLLAGRCSSAKNYKEKIEKLMAVPLVQGTLRYAYITDKQPSGEKDEAEGAVFAAAVLPLVHACNAADAEVIYNNMAVGSGGADFGEVRLAFERNYKCMGITCEDVGGLWDGDSDYLPDAAPCTSSTSSSNKTGAIVGGVLGGLAAALIAVFVWVRCRGRGAHGKDNSFVPGQNAVHQETITTNPSDTHTTNGVN